MDDNNTFYLVNGVKKKTYAVKANPDILKYKVRDDEKGMTPDQLLQRALEKVCGKDPEYLSLIQVNASDIINVIRLGKWFLYLTNFIEF